MWLFFFFFFTVIDLFFLMLVITYILSICLPDDLLKFGGISIKMLLKVHLPCFSYTKLSLHKLSLVERLERKKGRKGRKRRKGRKQSQDGTCEEYFSLLLRKKKNKTKQLRKVPFIPYKANVYLFEYFWFFPLSTQTFFFLNFFFYILLIAFKVFLCLFVLGVYSSQCILEYAWDWDKSPESREEKSESYFFLYICTLYYLEEILMGKNSL